MFSVEYTRRVASVDAVRYSEFKVFRVLITWPSWRVLEELPPSWIVLPSASVAEFNAKATAEPSFSAASLFVNPSMRYEKTLESAREDGRRRLTDRPNFLEFERELKSNVRPSSLVYGFGWWENAPPW